MFGLKKGRPIRGVGANAPLWGLGPDVNEPITDFWETQGKKGKTPSQRGGTFDMGNPSYQRTDQWDRSEGREVGTERPGKPLVGVDKDGYSGKVITPEHQSQLARDIISGKRRRSFWKALGIYKKKDEGEFDPSQGKLGGKKYEDLSPEDQDKFFNFHARDPKGYNQRMRRHDPLKLRDLEVDPKTGMPYDERYVPLMQELNKRLQAHGLETREFTSQQEFMKLPRDRASEIVYNSFLDMGMNPDTHELKEFGFPPIYPERQDPPPFDEGAWDSQMEKMLWKTFGIYKYEEQNPHGMTDEQYALLRHHFDTHMDGNDAYKLKNQPESILRDIQNPTDREDTWHSWIREFGPAYAQGSYGRNLDDDFGSYQTPYLLNPDLDQSHRTPMSERFKDIRPIDEDDD